jgi:hypothetical protein
MAAFYTVLYVAPMTDAEAIAIDADEDAKDRYPSAWLRQIGDEELVALWDVLDASSNEGTLMGDLAYASPDGEVMVMPFPKDFVVALAAADLEPVAQQWRSTDLMQLWSQADLLGVLQELRALCKCSLERGHPVLQVASF